MTELSDCNKQIADEAVAKTFAILGVDINNPASVEEFREDLRFGKKLRLIAGRSSMAFCVVVAAAVATALWTGLVQIIKGS